MCAPEKKAGEIGSWSVAHGISSNQEEKSSLSKHL